MHVRGVQLCDRKHMWYPLDMKRRKHLDYKELEKLLLDGESKVPTGSIWRHFKGGDYRVLRIVFDSETLQLEVAHESVDHPEVAFTRTLSNWLETVDFQGFTLSRFEMIQESSDE